MASIPLPTASTSKPRASATASTHKDSPTFGIMWTIMRSIGDMSLPFFFSSIHISSCHHVPSPTNPLIVCSNHSNTLLDVAILASHFPERRPLHFWAKAGFFRNPITRFILTSSGNIKVDRRNKNNQALFEGTFEAMKNGGAIALFPEGGSYTIPNLAALKMGAAWAALEYSRYLQQQEGGEGKTGVKILPTAVVFDDKSKFRSRAVLKFGKPLALDGYVAEFLSAPSSPSRGEAKAAKEDGTVPATPQSMTRSNTDQDTYASPAHRAVARLTKDLQSAMEALTFNAPDWETFQAVRMARELLFEGAEGIEEYVELSRAILTILTLDQSSLSPQVQQKSQHTRRSLFVYSCLLHLADVDNTTLAKTLTTPFATTCKSLLVRLPIYIPIFGTTLLPTYVIPNALAHHFAGREEESLSSVKTLFSFLLTSILYSTLLVKTMAWSRWSPPGLLVGMAGVWWLHDLNRSCVDTAYGLVKQVRFGWRAYRAGLSRPQSVRRKQGSSLFFYGTLVHPKILSRVIGNDGAHLHIQNAVLDGAKLYHVKGAEYPGLLRVESSAASINAVKGTLVSGLTASDLRCLDAFEGDEYTRLGVSVIPDTAAPIETNSARIANAGSAPLHAILSSLTPARIASLCSSPDKKVDAEVYTWTAGADRLEAKVWEFDAFAQTHAANWVGEGEVEHEHEYQVVDRVRSDEAMSTPVITVEEEGKGDGWIEGFVEALVEGGAEGRMGEAAAKVCKMLSVKPSIQFYVDRAFEKGQRPQKRDKQLLEALVRAREAARQDLEQLIRLTERADTVEQEMSLLQDAKTRALRTTGKDSLWPFTTCLPFESKKTI